MRATEIAGRYPATVQDRLIHLAHPVHDVHGRWLLTFTGRLDPDRIARAFELSLDAEPVLGCRFVERPWRPYWERVPEEKRAPILTIAENDDEDSINAWLGAPLDATAGIQVRSCLFRGSRERLAFKLSHEAADAGGLLDYLSLIGRIYGELGTNPAYRPLPQSGRPGQRLVLRNAGLRRLLRGCLHFSAPAPGVKSRAGIQGVPAFASRSIGPVGLSAIREYCKKHGVTVHEVIYAAFYRAQFRLFSPPPGTVLTIPIPIDLRRFLPAGTRSGVCNLFAGFFGGVRDKDLDGLVLDVHRLMARARSNEPWLAGALLLELMFLLPHSLVRKFAVWSSVRQMASGNIYPYITNYGVIDPGRFDFGDAALSDLETWAMVPNHPLPYFSVYTVGNTLRVTVSTRDRPKGGRAERLLDDYVRELPGQGSPAGFSEKDVA